MEARLHLPLRAILVGLALLVGLWGLCDAALSLSAGLGALGLGALAIAPHKIGPKTHYLLVAAMLAPWAWQGPQEGATLLRLGLVTVILALWSNIGLRKIKEVAARQGAPNWRDAMGLAICLAMWGALGAMGGILSTLVWEPPKPGAPVNLLVATVALVYQHVGFYLRTPPTAASLDPASR